MSVYLSPLLRAVEPYVPGEQPRDRRYVKLNTNESPYPPSPAVLEAAERAAGSLNLYCDPTALRLREAAAEAFGVSADMVLPVNGSDEILNFAFMAYGHAGIAVPDISYGFYAVLAELHRVHRREIPLRPDFSIDHRDWLNLGRTAVLANPNAPTGLALPLSEVEEIVASNRENVVVIDEAYVDFGAGSAVSLTKKYDNLLVTRTFSKSHSLAGARLGFGIASPGLIADLTAVKDSTNPYNVNAVTQAAGIAAFGDNDYYMANCRAVAAQRDRTAARLRELGFEVTDSRANFLFARHPGVSGGELYEKLRERGILVRHFSAAPIAEYNRVTVGTGEQMDVFVRAVEEILA